MSETIRHTEGKKKTLWFSRTQMDDLDAIKLATGDNIGLVVRNALKLYAASLKSKI